MSTAATRPTRLSLGSPSGPSTAMPDVLLGLAVLLADDHVLGDVDQAPGQVARVGGAQRRVRQALPGAVRGDEVLEHRQPLDEVGLDRALDVLALRVGHDAAHARQLADLLERATGPGVGHHEDRVEPIEVGLHRRGATSSVAACHLSVTDSWRSSWVIRPMS